MKYIEENRSLRTPSTMERSVLAALRALVPQRRTTFTESLRVAEQQALRFMSRFGIQAGPVSEDLLLRLPRIEVEYVERMPTSGCSFWDVERKSWIIQVNSSEPPTRQRFRRCERTLQAGSVSSTCGQHGAGHAWPNSTS